MSLEPTSEQREHELAMNVFVVSSAMVGVCLTAIGILRLVTGENRAQTIGDDLLAVDAVVFSVSTGLAFWSFKTRNADVRKRIRWIVEVLFLIGLAVMAIASVVIAYALL